MAQLELTPRRWKRVEYDRLVELGVFEGEHIELLGGQLIIAEPHGSYHAARIGVVSDIVRAAAPPGWIVRVQLPIALDDESEPEPDVAVIAGAHTDYDDAHPSRTALVVEIADPSLTMDRHYKGSLYARAGVQDYWIVNLVDHVLEIHRDPAPDPSAAYGWRYRSVETLARERFAIPLAFPLVRVAVADLLP